MATVDELKGSLQRKLREARDRLVEAKEQVRKYEEFLAMLDKVDPSESPQLTTIRGEAQATLPSLKSEKADSVGRAVKQVIAVADGEFDIRGLANAIQSKFPNVAPDILNRRVSAILYRLVKQNEIYVAERGSGSAPNTYSRVRNTADPVKGG